MSDRCGRDGHHGLSGAHFRIDNGGRLAFDQQLLIDGTYHFALRGKQFARQDVQHTLVQRVLLAVIHRTVLLGHGGKQAIAEVGQKVG